MRGGGGVRGGWVVVRSDLAPTQREDTGGRCSELPALEAAGSPAGAAAVGWTLFVFPPHASGGVEGGGRGGRGGGGGGRGGGRDVFEDEASQYSQPQSGFGLWLLFYVFCFILLYFT